MSLFLWAAIAVGAELTPDAWLVLGPVPRPAPAFVEEATAALLLDGGPGLGPTPTWPAAGDTVRLAEGRRTWTAKPTKRGALVLDRTDGPAVAWAAATVRSDRFSEVSLSLDTAQAARVWVDGVQVVATDGRERGDDPAEGTVPLPPGAHRVLVQTATLGAVPWRVALSLTTEDDAPVTLDLRPEHPLDLDALLHRPAIERLQLRPDGTRIAVQLVTPAVPAEHRTRWTELRDVSTGALVRRLESPVSSLTWSWDGAHTAWQTPEEEGSTLWVRTGDDPPRRLIRGDENLGGFSWLPDGSLVFSRSDDPEPDDDGIERLTATSDRWPWGRDHAQLHQVTLDGATRQLTGGEHTWSLLDVHPAGDRLLVSRSEHDTGERPFGRQHVHELDLATLTTTELLVSGWFDSARYRPDGEAILVLGGPSFADGATVPDGVLPNEYDTQLYLWARSDGSTTPLTRAFDPTVQAAWWHPTGDLLLVQAQVGPFTRLFDLDPATGVATRRDSPVDVVASVATARNSPAIVYSGSSADAPLTLHRGDGSVLLDPGADLYADIRLGTVQDFDVDVGDTRLVGRVHLPPDHDPAGSYPVIVNYYGGTSPTSRSFGGRYPANWWAAHGYIVYILQPSGATGFGQAFSARHVNDWSRTTADEVLAATEAFLAAHPSADPERVGCIGASYGGFLTMRLATRSDRFGAAISHAGISNIAAYWGEGWWGHLYSALATAESYPWNAREIYVEQSPLFHADKITTPLLLLHGTEDMNVPLGESDSLFTALKVLGRDVEYVQYQGEGHWILDYPKRRQWHQTIVAYFDWKLKGDASWWEALYPE
ncbi:MAG: dipeptidyl aminopeptidase/acylaminoacyl peptidase [Myxococcota bacterium]|jgi:dipeptidyl aminopeptidase/acylaminoacyl peptidase